MHAHTRCLEFPCRVKTIGGQIIDLCLLHFSASPPYDYHFRNILLLDEIVDIEVSDLSLAHELRLESMLAGEIRMSFYPFVLKTKTGDLLLYNGTTDFVSNGEVKGSDIDCSIPFYYDCKCKAAEVSLNEITYVIGKWDNRLESLCTRYDKLLENKKRIIQDARGIANSEEKQNGSIFHRLWSWLKGV